MRRPNKPIRPNPYLLPGEIDQRPCIPRPLTLPVRQPASSSDGANHGGVRLDASPFSARDPSASARRPLPAAAYSTVPSAKKTNPSPSEEEENAGDSRALTALQSNRKTQRQRSGRATPVGPTKFAQVDSWHEYLMAQPPATLTDREKYSLIQGRYGELLNTWDYGIDPQKIFPARACLFVANLNQNAKDSQLAKELEDALSGVGHEGVHVHIKIRRDNRQMPYAFAQYPVKEYADLALLHKQDLMVCERPIRIERLRGNFEFIVHGVNDKYLPQAGVKARMERYGKLAVFAQLHHEHANILGVTDAWIVKYKYVDEKRDIKMFFKDNKDYKVLPFDQDEHDEYITPRPGPSECDPELLDHIFQRRCVFFGSLPRAFTKQNFIDLARSGGPVRSLELHPSKNRTAGKGAGFFGFVEYSSPIMAREAVFKLNHKSINKTNIRVHLRQLGFCGIPRLERGANPSEDDYDPSPIGATGPLGGVPVQFLEAPRTPVWDTNSNDLYMLSVPNHVPAGSGLTNSASMSSMTSPGSTTADSGETLSTQASRPQTQQVQGTTSSSFATTEDSETHSTQANRPQAQQAQDITATANNGETRPTQANRPQTQQVQRTLRRTGHLPERIDTAAARYAGPPTPVSGSASAKKDSKRKRLSGSGSSHKSTPSASPMKGCLVSGGKRNPPPQKEVTFVETMKALVKVGASGSKASRRNGTKAAQPSPKRAQQEPHPLLSGNNDEAAGYMAAQQMYGSPSLATGAAAQFSGPAASPSVPQQAAYMPAMNMSLGGNVPGTPGGMLTPTLGQFQSFGISRPAPPVREPCEEVVRALSATKSSTSTSSGEGDRNDSKGNGNDSGGYGNISVGNRPQRRHFARPPSKRSK